MQYRADVPGRAGRRQSSQALDELSEIKLVVIRQTESACTPRWQANSTPSTVGGAGLDATLGLASTAPWESVLTDRPSVKAKSKRRFTLDFSTRSGFVTNLQRPSDFYGIGRTTCCCSRRKWNKGLSLSVVGQRTSSPSVCWQRTGRRLLSTATCSVSLSSRQEFVQQYRPTSKGKHRFTTPPPAN